MADLIERQAAIKAIEDLPNCYNGFSDTYDKSCIIGVLEELPSAQRTGRWINTDRGESNISKVYCSICMKEYIPRQWIAWKYGETPKNYCPNCGARMEEQE